MKDLLCLDSVQIRATQYILIDYTYFLQISSSQCQATSTDVLTGFIGCVISCEVPPRHHGQFQHS